MDVDVRWSVRTCACMHTAGVHAQMGRAEGFYGWIHVGVDIVQ